MPGLGAAICQVCLRPSGTTGPAGPGELSLPEAEKRMLLQALERAAGNKSLAARMLGISRDTLRYRLAKLTEGASRRS